MPSASSRRKAPAHQNHLDLLLETYPDARIIQTHRDPIKCMASTTSLMGCLYYMRSNLPFDSKAFEDIIQGEATASRLDRLQLTEVSLQNCVLVSQRQQVVKLPTLKFRIRRTANRPRLEDNLSDGLTVVKQ